MRNYQEINVLKETRRNAAMAVKAIDALMGKVYNQELWHLPIKHLLSKLIFPFSTRFPLFCQY